MVLSEEKITKLYRIRKTVMQMLRDRGYLVEDVEINMSKEEFKENYGVDMKRTDLDFYKAKKDNPDDKIYVFFPKKAKVVVKTIKDYVMQMISEKVSRAIIVVQRSLPSISKTCISKIYTAFPFEVFKEDELLFIDTEHDLVREDQVLTDKQKKALLETYPLEPTENTIVVDKPFNFNGPGALKDVTSQIWDGLLQGNAADLKKAI